MKIVVDLETTGLLRPDTKDPQFQPGIVQIAWMGLDDDYQPIPAVKAVVLVNPERAVEPEAVKVHGIDAAKVVGKPTLPVLLSEMHPIFREADAWVGFNIQFDKMVMYYNLLRYGWETRFPWPSLEIDVMKIARDIVNIPGKQDVKYPNLGELHSTLFGEAHQGAHDAMADVRATARCARRLFEDGYL